MELTIKRDNLFESLQMVSGISDKNIIITESSISTSNDILSVTVGIDSEVKKEGDTCVDFKKLFNFAKNYTGDLIKISATKEGWLNIQGDDVKIRVPGLHKDVWPTIKHPKEIDKIDINPIDFKNAITLSEFAVGQNLAREGLRGLSLKSDGNKAVFCGADGHMAVRYLSNSNSEFKALLPHKSAIEILKVLDETSVVYLSESVIHVESGSIKFSSQLLGAEFPSIDKLFNYAKNTLKINRELLISKVNILDSIASIEKDPIVKFVISENNICIESKKMDTGDGDASIKCEYSGEEISLGINIGLLRKSIKGFGILKDENVLVGITSAESPILIMSESNENYRSFFMPVRIKW